MVIAAQNALLSAMTATDRMEVLAAVQPRQFRKGQTIIASRAPVRSVIFVETGTVAATVPIGEGEAVEVFVIGGEGVTGGWSCQPLSDFRLVARSDVSGLSIDVTRLHGLADRRRGVAEILSDYGARLARELAQNAACNLHHRIGPRLAKWLLRQDDREADGEIAVTAQGVADALGVQHRLARATLRAFESDGLLEVSRHAVRLIGRQGVESRACCCYDPSRSVRDLRKSVAGASVSGSTANDFRCEVAA